MANDVRVIFDEAAIQRVFQSPIGPVGKMLVDKATQIANRAKQLAPVDTGRLRDSISWDLGTINNQIVAHVGTNVEYARYVEFGTRFWSGHPFLIPAFLDVMKKMKK